MAATTQIHAFNGAGPTNADITSTEIRFKRADNNTVDALTPVPIPTSGHNYSWRKHTKLRIVTAPVNQITNLRYFSSGTALGTGIVHLVVASATYTQGSSGDEATPLGSAVDSATYTTSVPLVVNSGVVCISTDSFPTWGTQDYLAQQMDLDSTVTAGTSGVKTFSYRFDES